MDNLLDHSGFRLIFIDDDGTMSLKTPFDECKEDVLEKGYSCISHLWGDAIRWEDHPVKGVTWGVDVREEKRAKLLQIFDHYKGYWWMDVFCTDQDSNNKPLSIMGDVYRNCERCVCLLDIKIPRLLLRPPSSWSRNEGLLYLDHMNDVLDCKWNKRIWTMQEWILPKHTHYTAETYDTDLIIVDASETWREYSNHSEDICKEEYLERTIQIFGMMELNSTLDNQNLLIVAYGRECKEPKDYYYGVAGILGISISDGLTFHEAEDEFILRANVGNGDYVRKISDSQHRVYEHFVLTDSLGKTRENTSLERLHPYPPDVPPFSSWTFPYTNSPDE